MARADPRQLLQHPRQRLARRDGHRDSNRNTAVSIGANPVYEPGAHAGENAQGCDEGVNSYFRAFNMGTLVGGAQYHVSSVSFGVENQLTSHS